MSSILTNSSALTALQNLNNTQRSLSKTQNQISTGLKVSTAADNATNWSVSTQMKSDNKVLSTIKDTLKQNSALIKTATAALSQIVETIDSIKTQLSQAKDVKDTTNGYTEINKSLAGLGETLLGTVKNAAFNGVNLLNGSHTTVSIVSGFGSSAFTTINATAVEIYDGAAAGATGAAGALVKSENSKNFDLTKLTVASADIDDMTKAVDKSLKDIREYAAALGAAQNQIDAQSKFIEVLSDSLTNGVSSMVDADMNEASTRLQALQTQQQLGVQSLSIANQNSQMILKLFQ